ncbi:MAG: amidohydrolase family protein [Promethearchaeota archaeon]
MIIDMHVHPFCKEVTWSDLNNIANVMWSNDPKKRRLMGSLLETIAKNTSIDDYISLMEKFGIDKAVIVSFNITTAYGVCLVTNDDVADLVAKHPDKFIGFGCVDVPASDAMEQLEYAISSLGLKGIKLVPPVQKFDISDNRFEPLWRRIKDLNIPIWTHTGHQVSTGGSIAKFGHPMLIDELALRHEDIPIIMGHMGTPWFWDAWSVAIRHPNVYVDISAHPDLYPWFPWDAFTKYDAEDKVLFASDHPICHWNKILPAIKSLQISERFKQKILGKNAAKILGIKS